MDRTFLYDRKIPVYFTWTHCIPKYDHKISINESQDSRLPYINQQRGNYRRAVFAVRDQY